MNGRARHAVYSSRPTTRSRAGRVCTHRSRRWHRSSRCSSSMPRSAICGGSSRAARYDANGTRLLPMHPLPGGWFALETDAARAGSLYRFLVDGEHEVADPASRFNPEGVHGASAVVDPRSFAWNDEDWRAPPWPGAVLYELHVGAFTPEGTYGGVADRKST